MTWLKPVSIVGLDGTAEAMPLHISVPEVRVRAGWGGNELA
jgi:hypothetical protein